MKQIIALMTGLVLTAGAMAYPVHGGGIGRGPIGHTVIVARPAFYGGFGYRPFYSTYWGYNSLYAPYYGYGYAARPSKLDLKVEEINNDYQQQIADVRHDKSLSGSERRSQIRDLKHDRESSIITAKQNYYHPRRQSAPQKDDLISEQ